MGEIKKKGGGAHNWLVMVWQEQDPEIDLFEDARFHVQEKKLGSV